MFKEGFNSERQIKNSVEGTDGCFKIRLRQSFARDEENHDNVSHKGLRKQKPKLEGSEIHQTYKP
jgi:hypothetical protein